MPIQKLFSEPQAKTLENSSGRSKLSSLIGSNSLLTSWTPPTLLSIDGFQMERLISAITPSTDTSTSSWTKRQSSGSQIWSTSRGFILLSSSMKMYVRWQIFTSKAEWKKETELSSTCPWYPRLSSQPSLPLESALSIQLCLGVSRQKNSLEEWSTAPRKL